MLLQNDRIFSAPRASCLPHLLAVLSLTFSLFCSIGTPTDFIPVRYTPFSVYPLVSPRKSSDFGYRLHPIRQFSAKHLGIDLAAPVGTPIRAVSEGRVVFADPYAGYGNLIVIAHENGLTTHYAHCNVLRASVGDTVTAGQIIGMVGSSGMSTGPHLHFEVRINGDAKDPELFMPFLASQAQG